MARSECASDVVMAMVAARGWAGVLTPAIVSSDARSPAGRRRETRTVSGAIVRPCEVMRIELLYFDGCPSHAAFLPRLQELLARVGVDGAVEQRRVESDEAAEREQFLGSPTVLVDGVDVDPGPADVATTA